MACFRVSGIFCSNWLHEVYLHDLGSHPLEELTFCHPKGGSPNKKRIVFRILRPENTRTNFTKYSRDEGVFFPQLPMWNVVSPLGAYCYFLFDCWGGFNWVVPNSTHQNTTRANPIPEKIFKSWRGVRVLIRLWLARVFLFSCQVGLNCVVLRRSSRSEIMLYLSTSQYTCIENPGYFPIDRKKLK